MALLAELERAENFGKEVALEQDEDNGPAEKVEEMKGGEEAWLLARIMRYLDNDRIGPARLFVEKFAQRNEGTCRSLLIPRSLNKPSLSLCVSFSPALSRCIYDPQADVTYGDAFGAHLPWGLQHPPPCTRGV